MAGPALGPTIGGYIITNWDWRLVFFINLPIGIAATVLGLLLLRPGVPKLGDRFDLWGFVLSSLAFGLTLYGLSQVGSHGFAGHARSAVTAPVIRAAIEKPAQRVDDRPAAKTRPEDTLVVECQSRAHGVYPH